MTGEHTVMLEVEDVYFLTGLSWRGAPISLSGMRMGSEIVKDYIVVHYRPHSQPIKD